MSGRSPAVSWVSPRIPSGLGSPWLVIRPGPQIVTAAAELHPAPTRRALCEALEESVGPRVSNHEIRAELHDHRHDISVSLIGDDERRTITDDGDSLQTVSEENRRLYTLDSRERNFVACCNCTPAED